MKASFNLFNPIHFLALGFGSGLLRPAPGTWGTLSAIPVYLALVSVTPANSMAYLLITLLAFTLGIYLCGKTASDVGVHDHGAIVWDEIVGFLITLAFFEPTVFNIVAGFVLFRVFDIVKPWPIALLDKHVHGGFGIMIDDVLAGLFAWGVLFMLHYTEAAATITEWF